MTIMRRIENLLGGRPIRHFQRLDYDFMMNIFSVLETGAKDPLFDITFGYPPNDRNSIYFRGVSLIKARGFVHEFMRPHENYRVRGSQEGYYGKLSEKHYIELKKIPKIIVVDKYGDDEYPAPTKRRKMEDMLALSELSMSYIVHI